LRGSGSIGSLPIPFDLDRVSGLTGRRAADGGFDLGSVLPRRDPHVHAGPHLGGDDVRPQSAVDRPTFTVMPRAASLSANSLWI
jgi:hypothetical protein